jgi:hypothetical protein
MLGLDAAASEEGAGETGANGDDALEAPDEEAIGHALGRLEAALRARSAAGYDRS